jgi:hypothetical protein
MRCSTLPPALGPLQDKLANATGYPHPAPSCGKPTPACASSRAINTGQPRLISVRCDPADHGARPLTAQWAQSSKLGLTPGQRHYDHVAAVEQRSTTTATACNLHHCLSAGELSASHARTRHAEALGARELVQQRSTATVKPPSQHIRPLQASGQRMHLHRTALPPVVVQDVAGSSPVTHPSFPGFLVGWR